MNIWRFAVGLLGVVSEDICEIDLYKEHLAKIPSVQLSQVIIQVGGFVWRSLANRYETSTWICLSLRSCRSGEMLLTMVRCWRLIQAGSSETCLQNDAFQTQFLWGELFELTFKGVLRSRVWMIFERRMVWLGSLTPRLTATHQDYDMFSNEQATLINLRLPTVTRWKIDPMDWIGTTNKYWRFMKVHVPVSGNVKYRGWKWRSGKFGNAGWWDSSGWIYIPIYRVYKLGPENMFRLLCFLFSHPQSYNKISTTWREIILKKTWLYRYLEAILEGRQKHNQQTHPNWNRFSFSVTLETRPPSCSTFMSVPFVSAWGIGWMNGGLIFDSFFLHS